MWGILEKFIYFSNSNNIQGMFMVFIVMKKGQFGRLAQIRSLTVTNPSILYKYHSPSLSPSHPYLLPSFLPSLLVFLYRQNLRALNWAFYNLGQNNIHKFVS